MSIATTKTRIYMKERISIILAVVGFCARQLAPGQGTIYLSNLGQTPGGSGAVGNDQWLAAAFFTGNAPGGYTLNSIRLLMNPAFGNPSGFTVAIYNINGSFPGTSLVSLSGADPAMGGDFIYTAPGTSLSPSIDYFVVITAATPVANGYYNWSSASSENYSSSEGWGLAPVIYNSSDGTSWELHRTYPFQLAVDATAVPEPSMLAVVGLGLAALSFWRFRQSKN